MGIGSRIRAERERQNISRTALAKAAGIGVSTLSDLELGYSSTTTALHRIAKHLGVRVEYLETGSGSPRLNESSLMRMGEQNSPSDRDLQSLHAIPDPAILHEAVTLLLFDLDHGGPRTARSATNLLLDLYRRIQAAGGELPEDESRAFEEQARSRGGKAGVEQHERSRKRGR